MLSSSVFRRSTSTCNTGTFKKMEKAASLTNPIMLESITVYATFSGEVRSIPAISTSSETPAALRLSKTTVDSETDSTLYKTDHENSL